LRFYFNTNNMFFTLTKVSPEITTGIFEIGAKNSQTHKKENCIK